MHMAENQLFITEIQQWVFSSEINAHWDKTLPIRKQLRPSSRGFLIHITTFVSAIEQILKPNH
jgi:hypothetical protein